MPTIDASLCTFIHDDAAVALFLPDGPSDVIHIAPAWLTRPFPRAELERVWSDVGSAYRSSGGTFAWLERRLVATDGRVERFGKSVDVEDRRQFYSGCPFYSTATDLTPPAEWQLLEFTTVDGGLTLTDVTSMASEKALRSATARKKSGRFLGVRVLAQFYWHAHM